MHRPIVYALIVLCLSTSVATAQSAREELTMHRKNVGELDGSGWVTAKSTNGAFSVRMPLTFSDFTVEMPASNVNVARTFGIGAKSKEGVRFVVQRIAYRKPGIATRYFSRIESGKAFPTMKATPKPTQFEGYRAVDIRLENKTDMGHLRYVLLGDTMIFMIVEIPKKQKALIPDSMIQTFFGSLKVSAL